jgi:hypothetical protein
MSIVDVLNDAGYETVEGYHAVKESIAEVSDGANERLCSGYRVFPDGSKCAGCRDCHKEAQ